MSLVIVELRPTGPTGPAMASLPTVNLPSAILRIETLLPKTSIKFADSAPICAPKLPPVNLTKPGLLYSPSSVRMTTIPLP